MRIIALVAVLALAVVSPTWAEDAPILSLKRVSVAAGIDLAKADKPTGLNLAKEWEWKPMGSVAYNLGRSLSLTGSYARGLKTEANEIKVGLRLRLYRGSE